jgi:GT2 family glycosyltransferase
LGLDQLSHSISQKSIREIEQQVIETGTVSGACLMIRRSVLDQIGLLDENFYFFSEEVDLCRRAYQAGWKVVHLTDAHVIHVGGGTTGLNASRYLMLYQEKLRYFQKYDGIFARLILYSAIWAATLIKLFVYLILRGISLGRIRKDRLWSGIARGLVHLDARI